MSRLNRILTLALLSAVVLLVTAPRVARAWDDMPGPPPAASPNSLPPKLDGVGIDQHMGAQVPADLVFNDENGKPVHLGDYYGKRPIILSLVYFKCPMLCTLVLNDLLRSLNGMPSDSVGQQFDVITVSFDPNEGPELASQKKKGYIASYGRAGAAEGWHFLTGSADSIKKLTETVGFNYKWDPQYKQYVHAAGLTILTPEGKLARYFYGIDFSPNDLRLSLVEASGGKIASPSEQILLYCFHYDERTGKYGLVIGRLIRLSGLLTLAVLGTFLLVMVRRERAYTHRVADAERTGDTAGMDEQLPE